MQDGPLDGPADVPTAGDPIGGHRVLEPVAALPASALRLDPGPDLWDREVRIELTDVVLGHDDQVSLQRQAGGDPGRMRAALLEASAERGGLPPGLHGTALVGRVAARGQSAPSGPAVGDRVLVPPPVAPVPLWLRDVSGWSGGRRIPVSGHAIASARTSMVPVPDAVPAEVAVGLGVVAHVPAAVGGLGIARGGRVLILGPTSIAGAAALLACASLGARSAALVTSLDAARLVRSLGHGDPVLVAAAETQVGIDAVRESLAGAADVVFVGDPDRDLLRLAAAAVATDGRIEMLVPGGDLDAVVRDATGVGSFPSVAQARRLHDGSRELFRLWDEHAAFHALVEWRVGLAPAPEGSSLTGDDSDPEDV